jgi:outer membrane protein
MLRLGRMKRMLWIAPVLAAIGLMGAPLVAQTKPQAVKIGFINSDMAIEAHPDYAKVKAVRDQADKELKPLQNQLTQLQQKIQSGQATAKDQQDFQTLRQAYQDALKKWSTRTEEAGKPLTEQINKIIKKVAEENGFQVIMDYKVASASNLVVYAADGLDVTQKVIEELKK